MRTLKWAIACAAAATLLSCATVGTNIENADIYYANQIEANAALNAFDRDNANCPMWTNWQKSCSRINGQPNCREDDHISARPSTPFCVTDLQNNDSLELRSLMRFCEVSDYVIVSGHRIEVCDRFRARRPFNGRRLAALRSPACDEWSEVYTDKVVCRENDGTCNQDIQKKYGLYCSKFHYNSCTDISTYGEMRSAYGKYFGPQGVTDKSPVHMISCGE